MNNSPHIPFSQYPSAPDLEMQLRIYLGRGIFERASFKKLMKATCSRDIAVDVGAHVGSWSLAFSKLFADVISFEPHPTNREYLEKNLKVAKATNVKTYPFAVTNDTSKEFYMTALHMTRNSGGMHLITHNDANNSSIPVQCVKLDNILNDIPSDRRINTLKVDVEGMELDVIQSGTHIIEEHKPVILLEIKKHSQRYGISSEDIFDVMSDMGYRPVDKYRYDFVFQPKQLCHT